MVVEVTRLAAGLDSGEMAGFQMILGPFGLTPTKWLKVKVTQSCLTLCDPMDYTVLGILQARILEWIAFSVSRGSSQPRDQTQASCIAGRFFSS